MGFFGNLPTQDSLSTQLAKQIGGAVGSSAGGTPDMLMQLMKQKEDRQFKYGQSAVEQASRDRKLTAEEEGKIFEEGQAVGEKRLPPAEGFKQLNKQRIDREEKRSRIKELAAPEGGWSKIKSVLRGESAEDRAKNTDKARVLLDKSGMSIREKDALLNEMGYEPEERARIINPLPKESLSAIDKFPTLRTKGPTGKVRHIKHGRDPFAAEPLTAPEKSFFKESLADVFNKNPNADPLLIREQFEKKGINWRDFRDTIDQLEEEGLIDFSSNPEFERLRSSLQQPPLGPLKELLHGFKLVAR